MFNTMRKWLIILTAAFFWLSAGFSVAAAEPVAVAPEPGFTFPTVVEGNEVIHDFVIQNKGNATLEIQKVKTG